MQSGIKPYSTWQEAIDFLAKVAGWLPRDDRWCFCCRCWLHRGALASWPCCRECQGPTSLWCPSTSYAWSWAPLVKRHGPETAARSLQNVIEKCRALATKRNRRQQALVKKNAKPHEEIEGLQQTANQDEAEIVTTRHGMSLRSSGKELQLPRVDKPQGEIQYGTLGDGDVQPRRSLRVATKKTGAS